MSCHSASLGCLALITVICSTVSDDLVAVLHEQAADHRLGLQATGRLRPIGQLQQAHILLLRQHLKRLRLEARGQQHLDELFGESLRARRVNRAVERDHAAVGADRVAGESALVGVLRGLAERAAAGIVVLDDRARRLGEVLDQLARGAQVEQVVERQLLAVQLY